MATEYSKEALLRFLDYLAEKGLGNKHTIVARKAASNKMFSILDEKEASDLRRIDLDQIASRFHNLRGSKYTPKSLQVYRSRVGTALNDFFRYKENPANFKMSGSTSTAKTPAKSAKKPATSAGSGEPEPPSQGNGEESASIETINMPIVLRPTCIIQLNGIPIDMTASEAKKIANIVLAMAPEVSE